MARAEQSRIKRYSEPLRKNTFVHNDSKYIFKEWNTRRDGKGASYADDDQISVAFDNDITLYAIWGLKTEMTRYESLTITADNVAYDVEYTTIHYSLYEVKYYKEDGEVISRTLVTGTANSSMFGKNGDPTSETATSRKTHTITYTADKFPNIDASGLQTFLTAQTTITQYGYTPMYGIDVSYDSAKADVYGYLSSTSKTKLTSTRVDDSTIRIKSTSKSITLEAVAKTTSNYLFTHWTGIGAEGNTNTKITVEGKILNYNVLTVNCKLKPIATNELLVNLKWRNHFYYNGTFYTRHWWYWNSFHRNRFDLDKKFDISKVSELPYVVTAQASGMLKIKGRYGIHMTPHLHDAYCYRYFYGSPTLLYDRWHNAYYWEMPGGGKSWYYDINGQIPHNRYYSEPHPYWHYGDFLRNFRYGQHGFVMKLNNTTVNKYSMNFYDDKFFDDKHIHDYFRHYYLRPDWALNCRFWNVDSDEFEYSLYVNKGDKFTITPTFADVENEYAHCTIFINSIELDETPEVYYSTYETVRIADKLQDYKFRIDKVLEDKDNEYIDASVQVVKPKEMARDLNHLPAYTTTYETASDLQVVKIQIIGQHGYGYTKKLKVTDLTTYSKASLNLQDKVIFNSEYTPFGGELVNRTCYIYMPPYSKILIEACWHRVDTYNFPVNLFIYAINV